MASPNIIPNALASAGPAIASYVGNYLSGSTFWVDSTSSAASDSNAGTEPELPMATWTAAYALASAGDLIVCQPGHAETVSVAATLATARVMTIGLGLGSLRARFTSGVAGAMWTVTGARTAFIGCYFPASTAATTSRITNSSGTELWLSSCYFECGVNDTTNCVALAANNPRLDDCTFVATASRPARAVNITGAITGATFSNLYLDGGSFGWTSHAFDVTAAATGIIVNGCQLANRSDFYITTSGTSYKLFGVRPVDSTGGRVVLAA